MRSGELPLNSLRTPLLDASAMMKSVDPGSTDLRREFTRREHGAVALLLLWVLCALAFMRLHAEKADSSSEVGISWSLVFAPLLGMSVVSLVALLLSPLLLPREQRLVTEDMINGCLLALAVGSLSRFACGRLDPPPPGGISPPAVPALLPLAVLWLHAGACSVGRLVRPSPHDQLGGRALAVALVVGTYAAYGVSLWLLRWRLEALEAAPGNSSLARLSGTDAPPVAVSWWLVAAPLLVLHVARLLLACGGCVVVARGQPPPPSMPRGGADECDWRIAWEGSALSSSCSRLCSSLLLLLGLCTLAARLEAVAPADGAAAAASKESGTWGGAYLPFALLLLLPLCCCGCCALCVCLLAPGGTPAAATGGGGSSSKPRSDSGRGACGGSAAGGKGAAGAAGGATETSARQCARRGRAHSGNRPSAAEDEEAGGAPLLPGASRPPPFPHHPLPFLPPSPARSSNEACTCNTRRCPLTIALRARGTGAAARSDDPRNAAS